MTFKVYNFLLLQQKSSFLYCIKLGHEVVKNGHMVTEVNVLLHFKPTPEIIF
jgi:hypothetical protein